MKDKMQIPNYIQQIMCVLEQHHAQVFLVGGCVRDMLLKRKLHDYDLCSDALAKDMMRWFHNANYRVIPTGIKHGTISVLVNKEAVEITTFRQDHDYHNHRSPVAVTFSKDIEEDLKRRDFTINAIAYHPHLGIIDPFHGQEDIKLQLVRCVEDAQKRFDEDALRILRTLRFSCMLNFTIEDKTWVAIQQHATDLQYISKERIAEEFNRILLCEYPHTLQYLKDANILPQIIPEIVLLYDHPQPTPWHIYDIFTHSDVALDHTRGYSLAAKLAIVFHDIGKVQCETFDEAGIAHYKGHAQISQQIAYTRLKSLHYDNKTIKRVCTLIKYHDYYLYPKRNILRGFLAKFDNDIQYALEALDMQIADNYAKNLERASALNKNIEECMALLLQMEKEKDIFALKDLCINGADIVAMGYKGKQVGEILNYLYQSVLETPSLNQKEELKDLIRKRMQN